MERAQKRILENIEAIRERQRLTRKSLAEKINISESTYSRLMNEEIALSYDRLAKFAKVLEIPVIDIITHPDIYVNQRNSNLTKVIVELDVSDEEFIKLGLKDKVLQILNK